MYSITYTRRFKRDFKKIKNNNSFIVDEFEEILNCLVNGMLIDEKYKNHNLKGKLSNLMELHIKPDILLIYEIDNKNTIITLVGIGSHNYLRITQ